MDSLKTFDEIEHKEYDDRFNAARNNMFHTFLAPNLRNQSTSSGVTREVIQAGSGPSPKVGDQCAMHYTGRLLDGSKFDSSLDRGKPFVFKLGVGQVIKGWDEGVQQMSLGEKCVLTCTPDYAYGARGYPPVIPPNSTLKFEVELLKIN